MKSFNILLLPDGNRRWADIHKTTHEYAYKKGSERIVQICNFLNENGFSEVWLGLARPLNTQRDMENVIAVIDSCLYIKKYVEEIGSQLNITLDGRLDLLPDGYIDKFKAQERSNLLGAFNAHLLLGWSTDTEIERLLSSLDSSGEIGSYDREKAISYCAVNKPIDLVIRTGIEGKGGRLSGMIPWHSTDAELFFSDELFPDFDLESFKKAIVDYESRSHRNTM